LTIVRPLPLVTPDTESFWTGGEVGELRVKRCTTCHRLAHPSLTVCPVCHTPTLLNAVVSGRGTVVGFTINHQPWLPGFPPPYVVAVVALEEDPRVRLTTNIVGCQPDDVGVGIPVKVLFEEHEDVWLPLFEPDPVGDISDIGQPDPPAIVTRPMASTDKFEDKVAITGIGMSQVGRRLMRAPVALTVEACLAAVADAGLSLGDIDGLCTYPGGMGGVTGISEGGVTVVEEALGIHPTWHQGGSETPGQTGSVVAAMLAVAAGLCRHVLCFRTVWESTHTELMRSGRLTPGGGGGGRAGGDMMAFRLPFGAASAANWIAMHASQYLHRYKAGREMLGWVAINGRTNAARNPLALYRDPMTMDDYLSARMISTPFGLLDCDVPCDGSVAFIISRSDQAPDMRQPPVLVESVGTQIGERLSWDQGTLTHLPNVFAPAAHLWSRTSLRPSDVDVAELYDGFSFNCVSWLEALGFCGVGEAGGFLEGGGRVALDGELPLNTHGGQLSAGRTHGYGFLHEAVLQLRGQAGERQVGGAEVAAVAAGGGVPAGCFLLTRGR
jgi:acetyl-CoA acetyltransferase/uncharacterized OB-fold protein